MSREDPVVRFRLPEDLRAELKESAARHRRSLTAEIVQRLRDSLAGPSRSDLEGTGSDVAKRLEELTSAIKDLVAHSDAYTNLVNQALGIGPKAELVKPQSPLGHALEPSPERPLPGRDSDS